MATQITYSLIYTTHKLFPFIVATLFTRDQTQCATNSPGDQSPLSTANIKYQQQQHQPVPSLTKAHSFGIQNRPFRRRGAAESPAHSVLDLASIYGHQLQVLLRIYLIVQRKAQISKLLAESAKALEGAE